MAKVTKSVPAETVHTIELTNTELGYLTKLLGQCRANGATGPLYRVLKDAYKGSLPNIRNEERTPPITFE